MKNKGIKNEWITEFVGSKKGKKFKLIDASIIEMAFDEIALKLKSMYRKKNINTDIIDRDFMWIKLDEKNSIESKVWNESKVELLLYLKSNADIESEKEKYSMVISGDINQYNIYLKNTISQKSILEKRIDNITINVIDELVGKLLEVNF